MSYADPQKQRAYHKQYHIRHRQRRLVAGRVRYAELSVEEKVWRGIIGRCYCKSGTPYPWYGAKGIGVCRRWRGKHGFKNFLADMRRRPGPKYVIDRKRSKEDYSRSNCQWATLKDASQNCATTKMVTFAGKRMCLADWVQYLRGVSCRGKRK